MKKFSLLVFFMTTVQLFAQNTSMLDTTGVNPSFVTDATGSSSLGLSIIGILIGGFFYIALPVLLYCVGSYSLSLLNKHYSKKTSSRISWVPFVRYYDIIKTATKSAKKAFIITLLPWILFAVGILGVLIVGILGNRMPV
jgi:NADH:ubiquinone oxidoreductase subunit 5 (subunit L)/multisubunit Na+/H+ antiporter MnhA subunit